MKETFSIKIRMCRYRAEFKRANDVNTGRYTVRIFKLALVLVLTRGKAYTGGVDASAGVRGHRASRRTRRLAADRL